MKLKLVLPLLAAVALGSCTEASDQNQSVKSTADLLGAQADGYTRALRCDWDEGPTPDGTIYSVARMSKLVDGKWDIKYRIAARHSDGSVVSYPLDSGWGGDEDYEDYQVAGAPEDFPIQGASIQNNFEWADLVDIEGFNSYDCDDEIVPEVDQHTPEQVQLATESGTVNLRHPECEANQLRLGDSCNQMTQLPRDALVTVITMKRQHEKEPLTGNLTTRLYTFEQSALDPNDNGYNQDGMQLFLDLGVAPSIVGLSPMTMESDEGIEGLPDHLFAGDPAKNALLKSVIHGQLDGEYWTHFKLKQSILVNVDHGFEVEYHAYLTETKLVYFKLVGGF